MTTKSGTPTRAEYEQLKEDQERICRELESIRRRVEEQARELKVQFTRIAEMQAILDEERIANSSASPPRAAAGAALRPLRR
jgi:hypothetical protein